MENFSSSIHEDHSHEGADQEILEDDQELSRPGTLMHRVPTYYKTRQSRPDIYEPAVISMGPYHHGKPALHHAEIFKQVSLNAFISTTLDKDETFFHGKILERIQDIRHCYEELVEYDDPTLARLILRDACFFIYLIHAAAANVKAYPDIKHTALCRHFGLARIDLIFHDMYLLENQIPLWVIKFLVQLHINEGQHVWNKMIGGFLTALIFGEVVSSETLPWTGQDQDPLHFLDMHRYYHIIKVLPAKRNLFNIFARQKNKVFEALSYQFRSVTSLKAKGIRFRLSGQAEGPYVINFTSHSLYGELFLPVLVLDANFLVQYSNYIVYELSPTSTTDLSVTNYITFMKSLIEIPNDVKILREKGILLCSNDSDDEVVKVFKDLDTFGIDNIGTYLELKRSIESHCSSKAKTWIAVLINTYFDSPWTTTALLASFTLLCLTFLQTFFTIRQADQKP